MLPWTVHPGCCGPSPALHHTRHHDRTRSKSPFLIHLWKRQDQCHPTDILFIGLCFVDCTPVLTRQEQAPLFICCVQGQPDLQLWELPPRTKKSSGHIKDSGKVQGQREENVFFASFNVSSTSLLLSQKHNLSNIPSTEVTTRLTFGWDCGNLHKIPANTRFGIEQ